MGVLFLKALHIFVSTVSEAHAHTQSQDLRELENSKDHRHLLILMPVIDQQIKIHSLSIESYESERLSHCYRVILKIITGTT